MTIQFTKKYVNWHIGQRKEVSDAVAEKLIKAGVAQAIPAQSAKAIQSDELVNKAIETDEIEHKPTRKRSNK